MGVRFRSETAGGVFRLHFSEVTDMDEGDYTCEASNAVGFATTTSRVKIGSKLCYVNRNKYNDTFLAIYLLNFYTVGVVYPYSITKRVNLFSISSEKVEKIGQTSCV